MTATLLQGDCLERLAELPAGSCNVCITSPPYWCLRSYLPKGHALKHLEHGSEPSSAVWVEQQVRVFREVRRIMADHGVLFVNVGGAYASVGGSGRQGKGGQRADRRFTLEREGGTVAPLGYKPLDFIDLPSLFAEALRADGWYFRAKLVWRKKSPMPMSLAGWRWEKCRVKLKAGNQTGSGKQVANRLTAGFNERYHGTGQPPRTERVYDPAIGGQRYAAAQWAECPGCDKCRATDGWRLRKGAWRPTPAHEIILMFSKTARYYCDSVAAAEPAASATRSCRLSFAACTSPARSRNGDDAAAVKHDHESFSGGKRNPRDVLTFKASPTKAKHYAAFPLDLPIHLLRWSMSEKGYCPKCGGPVVRMVEEKFDGARAEEIKKRRTTNKAHDGRNDPEERKLNGQDLADMKSCKTIGWRPSCSCPEAASPRPGVVLDPYAGTGTVLLAAILQGHNAIGIELNEAYCRIARRRLNREAGLFAGK